MVADMARRFREQADAVILDRAAALFARQGFVKTSVQDIADAVGLSKAGLLHHYTSKDALRGAVLAQADAMGGRVLEEVSALPEGIDRDRQALEVLVDIALAHPGLVGLLLAPLAWDDLEPAPSEVEAVGASVLQAFNLDPEAPLSERAIRVSGSLGALALLTLAAQRENTTITWRRHIVATCFDALGHARPRATPFASDQVEA